MSVGLLWQHLRGQLESQALEIEVQVEPLGWKDEVTGF